MISATNSGYDLEMRVAEQYRQDGYFVIQEPNDSELPFDLDGYTPDLIAMRDPNHNLIIEVKRSSATSSAERYSKVAQIVAGHIGWRFLLITEDDVTLIGNEPDADTPTWTSIRNHLERGASPTLVQFPEARFLYAWSILESTLRRVALDNHIPIERQGTIALMNQLYSLGELDIDQFDVLKATLNTRNRVAHGFKVDRSEKDKFAGDLIALISDLVATSSPTEPKPMQ